MVHHHITRTGVVVPVRLDADGRTGPTPGQARGKKWRSVPYGCYVPSYVDSTLTTQRIVEAIAPFPAGCAVTGWAALHWMGARWFGGLAADGRTPLPVTIALGHDRAARPRPGVRLCEDWLFDDDVIVVDGLPVTVPLRSVSHLARTASHDLLATQYVSMAAYDDLVGLAEIERYTQRLGPRPGTLRLKRALAAASENAWSPQEIRMEHEWRREMPARAPLFNAPVFDLDGNHLFTPDLFDVAAGVLGEYNGSEHRKDGQFRRDLDREALCRRLGLESATMMGGRDSGRDFRLRLAEAYGRAELQTGPRMWTLERPDWWVDTSTVAARRALTPDQRAIWLRRLRRT